MMDRFIVYRDDKYNTWRIADRYRYVLLNYDCSLDADAVREAGDLNALWDNMVDAWHLENRGRIYNERTTFPNILPLLKERGMLDKESE